MTLVLDVGGVTMLAGHRARLQELRWRDEWPPAVPAAVLTEALAGDHRRDFHENRLLRLCDVVIVDELLGRAAASLRTAVSGPWVPSAVDAIVVAAADQLGGATVLTGDPKDLRRLAAHAGRPVRVATG